MCITRSFCLLPCQPTIGLLTFSSKLLSLFPGRWKGNFYNSLMVLGPRVQWAGEGVGVGCGIAHTISHSLNMQNWHFLSTEAFPDLCKALLGWYPPKDPKDPKGIGIHSSESPLPASFLSGESKARKHIADQLLFVFPQAIFLESGLSDSSFWQLETSLCYAFSWNNSLLSQWKRLIA